MDGIRFGRSLARRGPTLRGRSLRIRRRGQGRLFRRASRVGVVVLVLAMLPMPMGAASANVRTPMPTVAGIRGAIVRLADWLTGRTPPLPSVPHQQAGKAPGRQNQVPAAVTRAVARAQGHRPGEGPGQLPAYAAHAAKVKSDVTGVAKLGGAVKLSGTSGKVMPSAATASGTPQVDSQWPANGYNSPTLTPELIGSGSDTYGSPLVYQFSVYDSTGSWITGSKWLPSNDWTVPSGTLAWNQTYYWTVQDFDSSGTGSLNPQIFALQTPVPQPLVYSGLAQDGAAPGNAADSNGPGYDTQNGNFTTQATDASVEVTGPALSIERTYNSLDPLATKAFGAGWSSVLDMRITPGLPAADGSTATEVVTYPDGEHVAFGLNADGTYTPPQGRYATLTTVSSGGFQLMDKNDATYQFTQSLGSGGWGITSIADAKGHALTFTYSSGQITQLKSAASQRSLYLTWSTPSGASFAHVASVATDPVTPGNSATAITWQYNYSGDRLSSACNQSQTGQPCTAYSYQSGSNYPAAVLDSGPQSYWRLNEGSGSTAASSVLTNEGTDNATYSSAARGVQPQSPLAGTSSSVGATAFNNAYAQVPGSLAEDAGSRSVSLWFDTTATGGVLFSQSADPITSSTSANPYSPLLYIGSSGKLYGGFAGAGTPLASTAAVNNGNWHDVVLTSCGTQEILYIDGAQVASKSVTVAPFIQPFTYLGAGFLGGSYPDEPHSGQSTATAAYFNGALSDAATWDRQLTAAEVSLQYTIGTHATSLLSSITRPSGKAFEQMSYDPITARVTHVTDADGGSWTVGAPSVSGSSQTYVAAVEGAQPEDYWRLADTGTSTAVNQVKAGTATYSTVTQGVTGGPFADTTVDGLNGSSSYLALPYQLIGPGQQSVSLWFKTTATDEVLLSSSVDPISNASTSNTYTPNLYIGSDGYLWGEFDYQNTPIESGAAVNDGQWHNVVLAAASTSQVLYLDGKSVGTVSGSVVGGSSDGENHDYVGAGFLGWQWPDQPNPSTGTEIGNRTFFTGDIAEVAFYPQQLSAADASAQWVAAQHSPGLTPVEAIAVTDPDGRTLTDRYDPLDSGRVLSHTDGLGDTTSYGYDSAGFQSQVIDPNGDITDTGYDIRGNVVSTTVCQNQSAGKCATSYSGYQPNDTAATETPGPTDDEVLYDRDPRSSSPTDNTYLTTYAYDANGNLTTVTTPPVPGHSSGRTTTYAYTDWSSSAGSADGTSVPPAGLEWKTTSPAGAVTETLYNAHGDVVETINADGLKATYTYDGIGRKTSETVYPDTYPNGLVTAYTYDADGRVTQETDPAVTDRVTGAVHTVQDTSTYDIDGDLLSETAADTTGGDASRTASYTYDSYDRKASSTDPARAVTNYTYDAYGHVASETDPAGNVTGYAYDPNDHLLTMTLQNYTGSPAGSQQAAPLIEDSRAYDPAGRLASVTDAMGRVTSYTYTDDGLTAAITRSGPGGGSYVQEADTYDPAGNLVTQVTDNGAASTNYSVDAADRVASQTVDPSGLDRVTAYTYDPDDHVATQAVSQGANAPIQSTTYTYDPMGNKTSEMVDDPGAEGPAAWWTLTQTSGTTVADTSGTGNAATASGVGWSGSGAVLSGQSGEITTRGPVVDTTGSFSVSAWVMMSAKTGNDEDVASQDAASVSGFYLKYNSGSGTWQFTRPEQDENNPPNWSTADSGAGAQTGVWTFLTGVFNANTGAVQLYVNGADNGVDGSDSSPLPANGPVEIGAAKWDGQTGGGTFDGSLTNVELYPTALSPAEVANLYGQGRGGGDITRDNVTTNWQVDQLGQVVEETNPDGITTGYSYDEAGSRSVVTGPPVITQTGGGAPATARSVATTGYNSFGEVAESRNPDGYTTTYAYDADGRNSSTTLPSYTQPGASSPVSGTSTQKYDTLGEMIAQTDPDGNTMQYSYDQLGDKTGQTDPGGGVTTTAYDADGEQLSQTGPTGAQTTATYDYLDRQLTDTAVERYPSAAAYTTTTSYAATAADPSGAWKSSVTTPDGVATSYGYNAAGETTQIIDGAGDTTRYSYDALGRQVNTVSPDGTSTAVTYDPAGNQLAKSSLDASGKTLTTETAAFNGEGDQLSTTDALGDTTSYTYDAAGSLTAETQPVSSSSGIVTTFGYDAAGNQTRYTDGNGHNWITTYNSRGLAENQVEPATATYSTAANSTTTTAYDGDGKPVAQSEPGGVTVNDTYDSMGDLTGQSGAGATAATATRSFTYDTAGNMLTAATSNTAASGQPSNATSETFAYNDRGLVLSATGSAGATAYTWNGDKKQSSVADAAGTTSYTYDNTDRLHSMADPASGATLTYAYNAMSQASQISYGASGDIRAFGYNSLHELTSDTLSVGGTTVASIGYGYNLNGDITSKTTSGFAGAASNTYGYDQADRLTSWTSGGTTTGYAYDGAGNRVQAGSTTYTYDARDELTSDGTSTYSYSADGDLSSVTNTSGTSTSTSDAYGQQGAQGAQSNTYDALGRDVGTIVTGPTGVTTALSYEGTTGQLTSDGAFNYTWTPDGTLIGTAGAGTSGSGVLDLTDHHTDLTGQFTANGTALSGSRAYGPWGVTTATGGAFVGTLGYQSQYTSPTTGQVDMGARWYNPSTGSFGNKDTVANKPVPDSASASPFGYAADNPLGVTDPTGHYATPPPGDPNYAKDQVAILRAEAAAQKAALARQIAAERAAAARAAAQRAAAARDAAAKRAAAAKTAAARKAAAAAAAAKARAKAAAVRRPTTTTTTRPQDNPGRNIVKASGGSKGSSGGSKGSSGGRKPGTLPRGTQIILGIMAGLGVIRGGHGLPSPEGLGGKPPINRPIAPPEKPGAEQPPGGAPEPPSGGNKPPLIPPIIAIPGVNQPRPEGEITVTPPKSGQNKSLLNLEPWLLYTY